MKKIHVFLKHHRRASVRLLDHARYLGIDELRDWTYTGEPLVPLKGFPGVVWERPGRKKHHRRAAMF